MKTLTKNITNLLGEKGIAWLNELPNMIQALSKAWSLTSVEPVSKMSWNYVATAMQQDISVVLKICHDKNSFHDEYQALQHFNGKGSIRVLNINDTYHALLLECAIPGQSLKTLQSKELSDCIKIYSRIINQLSQTALPVHFQAKHATDWLTALDRITEHYLEKKYIEKAKVLRNELIKTAPDEYLCHGDLHLENILKNNTHWLAIDPKGIIGEKAFEAAAFDLIEAKELNEQCSTVILERAKLLAKSLNIELQRLLGWIFLRVVMSAQWFIEDNGDPSHMLSLAHYVYPLLDSEHITPQEEWHPDITITEEVAKQCIENQFESLSPLSNITCIGEGWDNKVFLVNNTYIFRFPHRQIAVQLIERENTILRRIHNMLPLETPYPSHLGKSTHHFPYPFHGYSMIEGKSGHEAHLTNDERVESIVPLAEFLKKLHGITEKEALEMGGEFPVFDRANIPLAIETTTERVRKIIERNILPFNEKVFKNEIKIIEQIKLPNKKTLVHGDLYCRHLMFHHGKLNGIIDWGDVSINTPAIDLAVVFSFYPPKSHDSFLSIYGKIDAPTWTYARFLGLYGAISILLYGHDVRDQQLVAEAKASIQRINQALLEK